MNIQKEQQTKSTLTNPLLFALQLGFFAGFIWGGLRWIFYIFRFTSVLPGFMAEPFYKTSFLQTTPGHWIGWLYYILFSMMAAIIYTFLFRKLKGPWPGVLYGVFWWGILFGLVGPMYRMTPLLNKSSWNTNTTEFCVFLLWGLFIGYTVAMEYTDERGREPEPQKVAN